MSVLEARGLNVRFGGHSAVTDVDLDVEAGSITGLIGPNGAGKTTTFNALCGLQALASGRVRLDDVDVTDEAPHLRARRGLARTFQRLELFSSLTVRENLLVPAEYRESRSGTRRDPDQAVDEAIERVGLDAIADVRAGALSTGQARLVELARALVTQPSVLLLDEPASGLDHAETEDFVVLLRRLAADGMAILLVEHDMPLVMSTCQTIHVLDFGRLIAVGTGAEVRANPAVVAAYLGNASEAAS